MEFENLVIITVIFLLAGLVKGVVGLGLPTLSIAALTATLGLPAAMAIVLLPSFVTNLWQAVAGGALRQVLKRLWPLFLAVILTTWLGVSVLAASDEAVLSALLALIVILYSATSLMGLHAPKPGAAERWLSPLVGAINGVLTGLTGSFIFPGVLYLQALGLPRDLLVQAMGMLFLVSTLALAGALGGHGLMTQNLGLQSLWSVVPALAGMFAGQKLRKRLSEAHFRKILFYALLLLGGYILYRSL